MKFLLQIQALYLSTTLIYTVKQPSNNGKIIHMNKITNYFYIFSKLTTSLVLLFIVFLMGYALFNSYKDVEITNSNLEDKLILLSNSIDQNNIKLSNIDNKLINNDKIINEIKNLNQEFQ